MAASHGVFDELARGLAILEERTGLERFIAGLVAHILSVTADGQQTDRRDAY